MDILEVLKSCLYSSVPISLQVEILGKPYTLVAIPEGAGLMIYIIKDR